MALINCPECSNSVSDKAFACPRCGYPISQSAPLQTPAPRRPFQKPRKYHRLPNNFGTIKRLSGKRRRPFAVYPKCTGYHLTGSPVLPAAIGYFETYDEAYSALSEYHKNPYDTSNTHITFREMFEIYQKSKEYELLKDKSVTSKLSAYKHCECIYDIEIRNLNKAICEDVLDRIEAGSSTKKSVLSVIRTVIRYAMDMNLVTKDCTANINIEESDPVIDRIPFSKAEIAVLWQNSDKWQYKILLILLYSGMRVNELLKNEIVNVNFEEKYIYVPKNLAKNKESERKVPMHDRVLPLVRSFVDNPHRGSKTNIILNDAGTVITYNNFCARDLPRINKALEHEHKFHDTRHTFASMGTEAGIPELYMQKIMGHKPKSILYNTYTHISMDELLSYVNKL